MTNNKRVLVTIGLAHRNYKTIIASELVGWAGGGSKFESLWFLDEDIEFRKKVTSGIQCW